MAPKAPEEFAEGNTKTSAKRCNSGKRWCFTYNNYDKNWMDQMAPIFKVHGVKWKVGVEVGESGTPHLQGYIECESKLRPMERFKLPKEIHWEAAKGNRIQNIKYVCKEGNYHGNLPDVYIPECVEPWGWQIDVKKIMEKPIDNRSIEWFWEPTGNVGKSDIVRWLVVEHNAMICAGKAADMKYQILNHFKMTGEVTWNVVFDVPRSMEKYLSYSGIEEIKNGLFASSKYESGTYTGPRPRVFVFANFAPEPGLEMSADRFNIRRIVVKKEEGEVLVSQTVCHSARMTPRTPSWPEGMEHSQYDGLHNYCLDEDGH